MGTQKNRLNKAILLSTQNTFNLMDKKINAVLRSFDIIEPQHEISNNVVCATGKPSDQPAHTRSLIRAFACRLNIL